MIQFVQNDVGRLVEIQLDREKNLIARLLGASNCSVYGRIIEVGADYLKMETITNVGIRTIKGIKQIEYDRIKDYKFT